MKKYQVEEFSYFFLRLKDLKAFYLSSEGSDFESNEASEYLKTVNKTHC